MLCGLLNFLEKAVLSRLTMEWRREDGKNVEEEAWWCVWTSGYFRAFQLDLNIRVSSIAQLPEGK